MVKIFSSLLFISFLLIILFIHLNPRPLLLKEKACLPVGRG